MCQAGSLLSPWRLGLKGSRHPVRGTPDVVLASVYHLLVFQSTGNWREKNTLSFRPLGKHRAAHLWGPCDKVQDKWERRSCFRPCLLKPLGTPVRPTHKWDVIAKPISKGGGKPPQLKRSFYSWACWEHSISSGCHLIIRAKIQQ